MKNSGFSLPSDIVPPLFIPAGFFEKKIKIRYGYSDYKKGWVNINPLIEKYSFEDSSGADLKILLEEIPLFWKKRISCLDINKNIDCKKLEEARKKILDKIKNPFLSKEDNGYFFYVNKYKLKRKICDSKLTKPLFRIYQKSYFLKKIYKNINNYFFSK